MNRRASPGTWWITWTVQKASEDRTPSPRQTAFSPSGVWAYRMFDGLLMSNTWIPPFPYGLSSPWVHEAPGGTTPPPRSSVTIRYLASGVGSDSCETETPSLDGTSRLLFC